MKHKTAELECELLNQAVAHAREADAGVVSYADYCGSWEYGGPIIQQARISLQYEGLHKLGQWSARTINADRTGEVQAHAETPLTAAMRAFVMAELGPEVELP
jgi:hypothetical protein